MPPINFTTALIVVVGLMLNLRAFLPLIHRETLGEFGFYMMRGAIAFAVVSILRSGYWDISQYLFGERWLEIRAALGGQQASAVFNVLWFWPIRDFLKARLFLVPEYERDRWRWWTVWAHPGDRCIIDWRARK